MTPELRARVELLRERAASEAGLEVTCGGVSMEPAIRRGDRVVVRSGRPRRGAVAAFVTGSGEIEIHRLVATAPGGWWAHLGDNQSSPSLGLVHSRRLVGIAEVPARSPRVLESARAWLRFGRGAARVALRRLGVLSVVVAVA
jgi:hypothetical protein